MNRNLLSGIDPFSDNCYSYNIMASDNNVILNNSPMPPMLTIDQFRRMDQLAIEEYSLSIELMMENAGLQLARLVAQNASQKSKIMIGAGTGNNGGGGLVAARRLSGWGYNVSLNMPDPNLKTLPASQLSRAIAAGASVEIIEDPDFFVDAYFGFSQRLPLPSAFQEVISWSNNSPVKNIYLVISHLISPLSLLSPGSVSSVLCSYPSRLCIHVRIPSRQSICTLSLSVNQTGQS